MKRFILLLIPVFALLINSFSQTKGYLKYDSVYIKKDSGSAELIILNSTKDVLGGYLYNKGIGRTEFRKVLNKLNDSTYLVGLDTLHIPSNSGNVNAADSGLVFVTPPQLRDSLLQYVKMQILPPVATLSQNYTLEYTSASTQNINLTWAAQRQSATLTSLATDQLLSIIVGGVTQPFTQPSSGGSVGGNQSISISTNIDQSFYNIVTTVSGKSDTASINVFFRHKIYAGFVSTQTPSDADILSATGKTIGGVFSSTRVQSGSLTAPPSSMYACFAAPASFGAPTVSVNGLPVGYTLITRDFVNALGNTTSYIIAIAPYPTASGLQSYSIQ